MKNKILVFKMDKHSTGPDGNRVPFMFVRNVDIPIPGTNRTAPGYHLVYAKGEATRYTLAGAKRQQAACAAIFQTVHVRNA